ncbi:DNA mismatch repair protein [Kalmusia sp. IMI 367209]|nr:DNA mismatch repair protein [Kalmusia sp. IMI 367209]
MERHELTLASRGAAGIAAARHNSILPLPEEVVAQIKSSTAIVSLTAVVLELLKNALDAKASRVEAIVDFARGGCSVEDNGLGIAPAEFREEGGLGKLYCTSKFYSEDVSLGRNGTFLASLGAMSLLTIVSHHHEYRSHNLLTLHHSKVIDRQLPTPTQHEIHGKHGTRVTVRNLFGNLPVRVKQRGITAEQKVKHARLWEALKREVTNLTLSWHKPVSLKVRDADGKTSINFSGASQIGHESRIRSFGLHFMLNVLTQASYILHDEWPSWVPVSASTSNVSIKGAISLDPAPSKRVQFISLGVNPLTTESGRNELCDEVNRIFALSSFGTIEDNANDEDEEIRRQHDNRFKNGGYTNRQLKARKAVDRYPMFYLRLSLTLKNNFNRVESLFSEEDANLGTVVEVLNAMIIEWLDVHHFRPRKLSKKRIRQPILSTSTASAESADALSSTTPPRKGDHTPQSHFTTASRTPFLREADSRKRKRLDTRAVEKGPDRNHYLAFSEWSRVKSGNASFLDNSSKKRDDRSPIQRVNNSIPNTETHALKTLAKVDVNHVPARSLGSIIQCNHILTEDHYRDKNNHDEANPWTDPTTKQTYFLDARTGCVLPCAPTRSHTDSSLCARGSALGDFNKPLRLPLRTITSSNSPTLWLNGVLQSWDNPVFKPAETGIQQASVHENQHNYDCDHQVQLGVNQKVNDEVFYGSSSMNISKLSRAALADAQVMAQVDKKFILAKMKTRKEVSIGSGDDGNVLVLIDQHAADERIRVEDLLADLCAPLPNDIESYRSKLGHQSRVAFIILDKPIQFTVSGEEQELFIVHAARFAAWGILFDIIPPKTVSTRAQSVLSVTVLPPAISERCKADSQVLITFLRSSVWKYAEAPHLAPLDDFMRSSNDAAVWVRRLSVCPEGLIDIVNSRACRSAIMFNDELSLEECRELMRKLYILFHANVKEKVIALTIDDAPSYYTSEILQILIENDAKATFFVIGGQVDGREDALKELVENGMELGNHAMHDAPSRTLASPELASQIRAVETLIDNAYASTNHPKPPRYFRPGSGFFSDGMRKLLSEMNYRLVLGDIYPHDPQIPYWRVNAKHVLSMLKSGGIIICHDRRSWTVPMLRKVIPEMKRRGWRITSVSGLLEQVEREKRAGA